MNQEVEPVFSAQANGEQLLLPNIDVERANLYEKYKNIGQAAVEALARNYDAARFSYRDIVDFAQQRGKSPQEAGKIFTRFYRGLISADIEPKPINYERSRDNYSFPLSILGYVIGEVLPKYDDAYTSLLNKYLSQRLVELTKQP